MKSIYQNPFRVLGVWGNASEREIIRQKTRFNAYQKVNKEIEADTDFSFLPGIVRNEEAVQSSIASIEKTHEKIAWSLFWFSNFTPIDNTAINHLSTGDFEKAAEIWSKPAHQITLSLRKISALNNLSTLTIALAFSKNGVDSTSSFKEGLKIKVQVLERKSLTLLSESFGDETFQIDDTTHKTISDTFFQCLKEEIPSLNGFHTSDLPDLFNKMDQSVRQSAEDVFSSETISIIEKALRNASSERRKKSASANKIGKYLYSRIFENLKYLESILGSGNMTFQMLSDKVAQELIECSISYFNYHSKGFDVDPGDVALLLLNKAKSFAVGSTVQDRIEKNLPTIVEWQKNKVDREKRNKIKDEYEFIYNSLEEVTKGEKKIYRAKNLIEECKPKLFVIENELGRNSPDYIRISSDVVLVAQGMIVAVVNREQAALNNQYYRPTPNDIDSLNTCFTQAYDALSSMQEMKKDSKLQRQYKNNMETIASLKASTKRQSSGCYIATMAYGSYDHPQVIMLRQFRDQVLSKSIMGRNFINFYYFTSPYLVKCLKNNKSINTVIRVVLNNVIKHLGKK